MIVFAFEVDLDTIKANQHVKYLRQIPFRSKFLVLTHTRIKEQLFYLDGPLNYWVKIGNATKLKRYRVINRKQ